MAPHTQSREVLTVGEKMPPDSQTTFGSGGGCYITKKVAIVLALFFICSVVLTGLLVYLLTDKGSSDVAAVETTTQGPGTTAKPEKLTGYLLPRHLHPDFYKVNIRSHIPDKNWELEGEVEITMSCLESSRNITVHTLDIKVDEPSVKVMDSNGNTIQIDKTEEDIGRQFYIIHLSEDLEVGVNYTLSMTYIAELNDKLAGFYRSAYQHEGAEEYLGITQFQATDCRRAFPSFDEPGFRSRFQINLSRKKDGWSSISNMPRESTVPVEGSPDEVWDQYQVSEPMSTYLVAFVVSRFEKRDGDTDPGDAKFSVWARPDAIEQAEYARDIGPKIVRNFTEFFGLPFPLPKQDMIAVPDFAAGAMENWGLITYRETAMLFEERVSAASNKQRVAVVVAHELAHQWFGNLVTPKWWTDLWLNEGFASYVEYLGVDHVEPQWKMMEQFVTGDLQSVFKLDSLETSHPISIVVGHPDEITEIFDSISYAKGASIIRMMNHFLTEPTFVKGLGTYLEAFKFQNAEQDDLWHHLTLAAEEDGKLPDGVTVKDIMDTWTLQMGLPVVTVTRNYNRRGNTATLKQERFLVAKSENSTDTHDYKWWVPISYTYRNDRRTSTAPKFWFKPEEKMEATFDGISGNNWVVLNVDETGYYRVNYDEENWKMIIDQLKANHTKIPVINRAQIIDDAFNLARAGLLPYQTALDVTSYLDAETEYTPWQAALSGLAYIDSMLSRTSGYGSFKSYMGKLLSPHYGVIQFETIDNIEYVNVLNIYHDVNIISWSCRLGIDDCVDKATEQFSDWKNNYDDNNPDKPILSPNMKGIIFCNGVRHGSVVDWDKAWDHYLKTNVGTEKSFMLSAMGCTNEIWLLSKYLESSMDENSGIRKQDGSSVFRYVARNAIGRYLAWDYLRNNWNEIKEYFGVGIGSLDRVLNAVTGSFNTEFELSQLKDFIESQEGNLGSAERAASQAIERTEGNVKWMKENYQTIVDWLEQQP